MATVTKQLNVSPDLKQALQDVATDFAGHVADLLVMYKAMKTRMLASAGLVIKAGSSALVKTGASACQAVANGTLRSIAAATDMAALVGSVTNAKFNVYVFFIDSAGALTSLMGTEGATLAAVVWPTFPSGKACIGFTIINPTGTGPFVGGTTALDDATVIPNAVHVSVTGSFDPTSTQYTTIVS